MSFNSYYKKINVGEDEQIVGVIHQHPVIFAPKIILAVLIFLTPFFFMFRLIAAGPIGVSLFFALIIGSVIFMAREYYLWKYNVFILTTGKIIDYDQRGFFSRQVSEIPYQKIADITYETKGIINAIFGKGVVFIKTNVQGLSLQLDHVGSVKDITAYLIELVEKEGGHVPAALTPAQKKEHLESFAAGEDESMYDQFSLKELLAEYIRVYSKEKLKKLLAEALNKGNEHPDTDRR